MAFAFKPDEIIYMKNTQEGHMMDTCKIQSVVITPNAIGEQVESWPTDGSAVACGLEMQSGRERSSVDNVILQYDAVLRLPIGTVIDPRDHIKITKRFGQVLAVPMVYSIVSPIQQGVSGIRILLQRIEI